MIYTCTPAQKAAVEAAIGAGNMSIAMFSTSTGLQTHWAASWANPAPAVTTAAQAAGAQTWPSMDAARAGLSAEPSVADAVRSVVSSGLGVQLAANSPARNAITTNSNFLTASASWTVPLSNANQTALVTEVRALAQQLNVIIPNLLRLARLANSVLDADA